MLLIEFSFFVISQFDASLAAGSAFESPPETVDRKVVAVASVTKPDAKARSRDARARARAKLASKARVYSFAPPSLYRRHRFKRSGAVLLRSNSSAGSTLQHAANAKGTAPRELSSNWIAF
jgi:hypothetical protein